MADGDGEPTMITVHCKHGKQMHSVCIPSDASVLDLKSKLHPLTNVLARFQKLIFKGKVLDGKILLRDAGLSNDSKIMMIGSASDHQNKAKDSPRQLSSRIEQRGRLEKHMIAVHGKTTSSQAGQIMSSNNIWKSTGIISLQDRNLSVIPTEVWENGASVRVLDLAGNSLTIFPQDVCNLINLKRLRINLNNLRNDQIQWQGIAMLRQLTMLFLDHNKLTTFPLEIGLLSELKHLSIAHNMLENVSENIGNLSKLETINLSHNSIYNLPASFGRCSLLVEADFTSNRLTELPSALGQLKMLKILNLDNNILRTVSSEILKGCTELHTLSLHNNDLTIEQLREVDGWAEFNGRRKAKHDKKLDFSVFDSSDFDEGADAERWHHW